jgi:uncharacterized damage-inducible protein DinB
MESRVRAIIIALAEATPPEKFAWRPASGVRSTSEVYMHIVRANFLMLNAIGSKMRKTKFFDTDTTVDSIFLRIIVHNNEHMGQLVAYARMTGVVPPWSK